MLNYFKNKGWNVWDGFLLLCLGLCLFLSIPFAGAEEVVPVVATEPSSLFDLLSLLIGGDKAVQWLGMIGLVCYLFTHIIAWLPQEWVAKLPSWLVKLINLGSANYRGTKNASDSIRSTRIL